MIKKIKGMSENPAMIPNLAEKVWVVCSELNPEKEIINRNNQFPMETAGFVISALIPE